jgi:hypothetical protein
MWATIILGAVFGGSAYFLYADLMAAALRWWPVLNAIVAGGALGGILWMVRPPRQVTLRQAEQRAPVVQAAQPDDE